MFNSVYTCTHDMEIKQAREEKMKTVLRQKVTTLDKILTYFGFQEVGSNETYYESYVRYPVSVYHKEELSW